jgi:hypothetical protein
MSESFFQDIRTCSELAPEDGFEREIEVQAEIPFPGVTVLLILEARKKEEPCDGGQLNIAFDLRSNFFAGILRRSLKSEAGQQQPTYGLTHRI